MALRYNPLIFSGLDLTGGGVPTSIPIGVLVTGSDPNSILGVDGTNHLKDYTLTNGQIIIGSTGGSPAAANITGTTSQVIVTNGSNTITLSLPQSIATTSSPTFANVNLTPSGALDTSTVGTLAIGTGNANVINIGNSGATVNIQGTTFYQNVTNLNVANKTINLNTNGSAGSASNSGIDVEEGGVVTAYVDTTADRSGWELKAPATTGIVTITPGSSGFTLNQGSHNPVTIGTASGLSLSTQVLSLGLSSSGVTGALSGTDWTTFNSKQPAGNYITALTGDATASGPGSSALTLATVNSNVGSFTNASITVNAKGLITAASNGTAPVTSITIASTNGFTGTSSGGATPALTIATSVTGVLKGNGTAISAATPGTDYQVPLTFSTGLTNTSNTVTVNTSQNISTLSNLTTNGFVKTTGSTGALSVDTNTYSVSQTGDITNTVWSGLANNTSNQTVTGLSFASGIKSFDCQFNVRITATTNTFTTFSLLGLNKSSNWSSSDIISDYVGDAITGVSFSINTSGQVVITIGNIAGFVSAVVTFRAFALS